MGSQRVRHDWVTNTNQLSSNIKWKGYLFFLRVKIVLLCLPQPAGGHTFKGGRRRFPWDFPKGKVASTESIPDWLSGRWWVPNPFPRTGSLPLPIPSSWHPPGHHPSTANHSDPCHVLLGSYLSAFVSILLALLAPRWSVAESVRLKMGACPWPALLLASLANWEVCAHVCFVSEVQVDLDSQNVDFL